MCLPKLGPKSRDERSRRTSLLATEFSNRLRYTSFLNPASGSRSANSAILFFVRTSVFKFGILDERLGCIFEMRFWARNNVRRRGCSGKLPSCAISLSVRSIASLSCLWSEKLDACLANDYLVLTLAAPMFSIAEILCPTYHDIDINSAPKCSICSFQRTS